MGANIHIVHVVHRFDTGGLENGMVNLINRLDPAVYQHSIVTMKGFSETFAERITSGNVSFYDLKKSDGQDFGVFLRLNKLLKQLRPDVLHTRNTATLEMQLVGWWRRIPFRIHGEHGWDVNDMHGSNVRYQKLRRFMQRFIHQYVALSTEARDYLCDTIGIAPTRVNHICNGVDDKKFSPSDQPVVPFVVGCVGRLEQVKNHVLLAQAFVRVAKHAREKSLPVTLKLVGEGSCRSDVESVLAEGKVSDMADLLGNRSDVDQCMKSFSVFVLPSLAEGISNTILEAMASGLPVIATRVGGNAELVEDDRSGALVEVADPEQMATAIIHYLESPDRMQQHGQYGRDLVERKFSIHAMTKSYDELYRKVLKQ